MEGLTEMLKGTLEGCVLEIISGEETMLKSLKREDLELLLS